MSARRKKQTDTRTTQIVTEASEAADCNPCNHPSPAPLPAANSKTLARQLTPVLPTSESCIQRSLKDIQTWQVIVYKNGKTLGRLVSPQVSISALLGALDVAPEAHQVCVTYSCWQTVTPSKAIDKQEKPLDLAVDAEFRSASFQLKIFSKRSSCALPITAEFSGSDVAASISQHCQRIDYIKRQHNLFSSRKLSPCSNSVGSIETPSASGLPAAQEYVINRGDSLTSYALGFDVSRSTAQLSRVEFKLAVVQQSSPLDELPAVGSERVQASHRNLATCNSNSRRLGEGDTDTTPDLPGATEHLGGSPRIGSISKPQQHQATPAHTPGSIPQMLSPTAISPKPSTDHMPETSFMQTPSLTCTPDGPPAAAATASVATTSHHSSLNSTMQNGPSVRPSSTSTSVRPAHHAKSLYLHPHHPHHPDQKQSTGMDQKHQDRAEHKHQDLPVQQDPRHAVPSEQSRRQDTAASPTGHLDPTHAAPKNGKLASLPSPAPYQNGKRSSPSPASAAAAAVAALLTKDFANGHLLNGYQVRNGYEGMGSSSGSGHDAGSSSLSGQSSGSLADQPLVSVGPILASGPAVETHSRDRHTQQQQHGQEGHGNAEPRAAPHAHPLLPPPPQQQQIQQPAASEQTLLPPVRDGQAAAGPAAAGTSGGSGVPWMPAESSGGHARAEVHPGDGGFRAAPEPSMPESAVIDTFQADPAAAAAPGPLPRAPLAMPPQGWEQKSPAAPSPWVGGGAGAGPGLAPAPSSTSQQHHHHHSAWAANAASASLASGSGRRGSKQQFGPAPGGRQGGGGGSKQGGGGGGGPPGVRGGMLGPRHGGSGGGGLPSRGSSPALATYHETDSAERSFTPGCSPPPPEPTSTADLERFILQVTPMLSLDPSKPLDKALEELSLDDVWRFYMEPSMYGREVYTLGGLRGPSLCYFVPYLSAIQLFTPASPKDGPGTSRMYVSDTEGWPKHMHLKFEHFEHEMPFNRTPLYEHVEQLARLSSTDGKRPSPPTSVGPEGSDDGSVEQPARPSSEQSPLDAASGASDEPHAAAPMSPQPARPGPGPQRRTSAPGGVAGSTPAPAPQLHSSFLRDAVIADLHPASWFSVAWYPVYRIPDAPLCARFLTFHSFAPLVISMHRAHAALVDQGLHRPMAIMPLQVVGLKWYNMHGERWLEALSESAVNSNSAAAAGGGNSNGSGGGAAAGRRPQQAFQDSWQGEGGRFGRRPPAPQMDLAWQSHLSDLQVTAERLARGYGLRVLGQMGASDVRLHHPDFEFFSTRG